MSALRFPSDDALLAVLAARIVPDSIAQAPASWGRDAHGLWLVPDARLDGATRETLLGRGVDLRPPSGDPQRASCWAEVLQAEPVDEPDEVIAALFLAPLGQLIPLAGELLRLGCDRQQWATSRDTALLLTRDPPWYTVLKALDPSESTQVFSEVVPRVWVEVGYRHPLAEALRPPPGQLLLLPGTGPWIRAPEGPWSALYDQLDLLLPEQPHTLSVQATPPRISVPLRLVDSARSQAPSLWVIRDRASERLDQLLGSLPDDAVDRLLFAATPSHPPTVILRARPSVHGPPAIELRAECYAPLLELPNLYRPDDATLEPPLRREKIRGVLSPDPFEVAWLCRTAEGFVVERIAEEAFQPLSAWVDYIAHRSDTALRSWVESATFDFDDWVDTGLEWGSQPKPPSRRPASTPLSTPIPEPTPPTPAPAPPRQREAPIRPRPVQVLTGTPHDELAAELSRLERRFLDLDAPLDAAERLPLWRQMATLSRQLGRDQNASLCWVHALWDAPQARQHELAAIWASEELGALGLDATTLRTAVLGGPEPRRLYALVACLAAGALLPEPELTALIDREDSQLDIRASWIARRVVAGEDELGIARARDTLLARLRGGVSVERDVPLFLRMLDAAAVETLGAHLQAQYDHFLQTERNQSVIEADPALTLAYVSLIFSWGFAAIGDRSRARALLQRIDALDTSDPIHGALVAAYQARIEQALEGVPRDAPLPPPIMTRVSALGALERYKLDRLRQASGILETHERIDPFTAFHLGHDDPRGPEFAGLRQLEEADILRPRLADLLDLAEQSKELGDRARIVDGVLDFLPLLPVAAALPLLERATVAIADLGPLERTRLLSDALLVAGQLGRTDRVRALVLKLHNAVEALSGEHLVQTAEALSVGLRSLRRVGLQEEAAGLLEGVLENASGRSLNELLARVAVAGGLAGVGRQAAGTRVLDEGFAALDGDFKRPIDRLRLTRTLAIALSASSREVALDRLPRLAAHLARISDSFNTNSHFCLSVLHIAESVVLGYADSSLAADPMARRWLDDAEFLVRRRIHAES